MNSALSFSFHAVKRCLERGISEQNIMDTIMLGSAIADDGDKAVFARGRMRVVVAEAIQDVKEYAEYLAESDPVKRVHKINSYFRNVLETETVRRREANQEVSQ